MPSGTYVLANSPNVPRPGPLARGLRGYHRRGASGTRGRGHGRSLRGQLCHRTTLVRSTQFFLEGRCVGRPRKNCRRRGVTQTSVRQMPFGHQAAQRGLGNFPPPPATDVERGVFRVWPRAPSTYSHRRPLTTHASVNQSVLEISSRTLPRHCGTLAALSHRKSPLWRTRSAEPQLQSNAGLKLCISTPRVNAPRGDKD